MKQENTQQYMMNYSTILYHGRFCIVFVMGHLYFVPSCSDRFIPTETAPIYNLDFTPVL